MKKLLATIMALVLALTLVPAAWANTEDNDGVSEKKDVAKIGEYTYETLADAVAAVHAETGDARMQEHTITLLDNASGGGFAVGYDAIKNSGKGNTTEGNAPVNIVIDLNEKTYTLTNPTVGSSGTETNGFQLLKGSKVTFKNGTIVENANNCKILFQNYCDLTLENVTVKATNATCALSCNCGNTTLKNVSIATKENGVAIDLMHWENATSYKDSKPSMTISNTADDKISGKIEVYCWNGVNTQTCGTKPTLTISGGTFDVDPSTYLAEGYKVTEETKDSATTYTVSIETYTVTFNTLLGSKVDSQTVNHGNAIEAVTTTRDGYEFKGWYKESEFKNEWNTTAGVTEDMTLYAKWEKLASADTDTKKENTTEKTEWVVDTSTNTATETVTETTETDAVKVETKTETVIDTTTNTVKSTTETKTTETETAKTEVKTTSTGDTKTATAAVEVSNVKTEKIANAAVTIDATVAETNTNADVTTVKVTIPTAEAKKLESAKTVEVKTDVGTLTIDSTALKTITDNGSSAADEKVTLTITDTTKTALPAVSGAAKSFQLTAKVGENGKAFTNSKGTITITVPMAAPGFRQQHVCYYNDNGKLTRMGGTGYKNGSFSWNTNHFSTFVIEAETVSTSRASINISGSSTGTTATTTTTTGKASSATTFDAGVGIYAVSAILSVTGMAWVGKKH